MVSFLIVTIVTIWARSLLVNPYSARACQPAWHRRPRHPPVAAIMAGPMTSRVDSSTVCHGRITATAAWLSATTIW